MAKGKYIKYAAGLIALVLAMVVLIALSMIFGYGRRPEPTTDDSVDQPDVVMETPSDWPMFHGNPNLTGNVDGALPEELKLAWKFKTGDMVTASAIIARGVVYVGSQDGYLYALDIKTGKEIWKFKTKGPIQGSALFLNGSIYIGSEDENLYCIDTDGKEKWKYKTQAKIVGAPNFFTHTKTNTQAVLIGSFDNNLHCLDAKAGKVLWTYEAESYINGTAAITDSTAAIGSCDAKIHIVSLADGKELRAIDTGAYIAGSVALDGAIAYVGNYDNIFMAANIQTATEIWKFTDCDEPFVASPVIATVNDKKIAAIGAGDGNMYCFDALTGNVLWKFTANDTIDSSPMICGDKIMFGSNDGNLYMLDAATGKKIWQYTIGQPIVASPVIAACTVVIGSEDGFVYAFKPK